VNVEPALRLVGASVGYGGRPVVAGIDLELARGVILALVGTNGSGKSTVLRTLAGLLRSLGGRIEVLGGRPGANPEEVGYLSQFHTNSLLLPIRAGEVVRMGRFAGKGLLGRMGPDDREAVDEALELMDASGLATMPLRDLSGGQQQRIFIAQALARRANLLLLDEPAAGLDIASREALNEALAVERRRGAAVVVATHDIGDAMHADLVLLLAQRVIAFGPPEEVLTPETLLATFGLAIQAVEGGLMVMDAGHGHGEHDPVREGSTPG
jgi:ABC-type Mn2+/Zn2+ transport system ATPase subunit